MLIFAAAPGAIDVCVCAARGFAFQLARDVAGPVAGRAGRH